MRFVSKSLACGAALAAVAAAGPALASESIRDVAKSVHWQRGAQHLAASDATFVTPSGAIIVTGTDAQRIDKALNGSDTSDIEGYVRLRTDDSLYLQYNDSGYVTTDDFAKIDADSMMADIVKSTDDSNDERKAHGISPLHVDGWVARPTFDRATESARFVIAAHDDTGQKSVNAVALQLGRKGYERFTLVTDAGNTAKTSAELDAMTHRYRYATGSRFQDYVSGDKLAGVGIAALVGTAAGVTIAKTVGFGAIIAILLKFKILLFGALAAFFGRFRNLFKKKQTADVPAMPKSSPFETPPPPLNP